MLQRFGRPWYRRRALSVFRIPQGMTASLVAAEPLLAQIEHQRQVLFTSYNDVEMWPWAHDRVVFIPPVAGG